jgi:defect-in-organelle-trafficking protein DotC
MLMLLIALWSFNMLPNMVTGSNCVNLELAGDSKMKTKSVFKALFLMGSVLALNVAISERAFAYTQNTKNAPYAHSEAVPQKPPSLEELQGIPKINMPEKESKATPVNMRGDAVKQAALSYGIRGGLAWRTYEIRMELQQRGPYLDKIYNFRELLIPAPSGLLIEPPVVSEADNALIISNGGREAAITDRIYNMAANASIVSAPRLWNNYLEREWGDVTPPPDILRPENEAERREWYKNVALGWEKGLEQADEIFEADLNQLVADYQGMVRYRVLLNQGMVSPPYALQVDRGVTGGGQEMRIGDRAVQITAMPEFVPGATQWQPASR